MTKAETEKKKSLARSLYLAGMEQNEIAEKVDVSRVTISKWCNAEGWKESRAAKNITRPELVNKLLLTIDKLNCPPLSRSSTRRQMSWML